MSRPLTHKSPTQPIQTQKLARSMNPARAVQLPTTLRFDVFDRQHALERSTPSASSRIPPGRPFHARLHDPSVCSVHFRRTGSRTRLLPSLFDGLLGFPTPNASFHRALHLRSTWKWSDTNFPVARFGLGPCRFASSSHRRPWRNI